MPLRFRLLPNEHFDRDVVNRPPTIWTPRDSSIRPFYKFLNLLRAFQNLLFSISVQSREMFCTSNTGTPISRNALVHTAKRHLSTQRPAWKDRVEMAHFVHHEWALFVLVLPP